MNNLADRAHALWELFVKELTKFGLVGAAAFGINASLVWLLMHSASSSPTATSRPRWWPRWWPSSSSSVADRMWTFREKRQDDKKELVHFLVGRRDRHGHRAGLPRG
ncbi:hypothetical protein QJS66_08245 [Kocuria rhizophila]|nr:hypothetical protein QJS66_08245 [Kocuria rhizophila]